MFAYEEFGVTWWGKRWLNAFHQMDNTNRIHRGYGYALQKAVFSFQIIKNEIYAQVRSSKIYTIKISFSIFTKSQKDILCNEIKNSPYIFTQFLNRKLPKEVLNIIKKYGIPLFPKSWKDLKLFCNCPDRIVPCKHISAVIYWIAKEIDQNPFLIFQLHGVDILKELNVKNFKIEPIPDIFSLFEQFKNFISVENSYIDDSSIENMVDVIPSLYPKRILLDIKDFHILMKQLYVYISKNIWKIQEKLIQEEKRMDMDICYKRFRIIYDSNLNHSIYIVNSQLEVISFSRLFYLLVNTEKKYLKHYSEDWVAIYHIYKWIQVLLIKGAFFPCLIRVQDGYRIIWEPAIFNTKVKTNYQSIQNKIPALISWIQSEKRNDIFLWGKDSLLLLSFMFINEFIKIAIEEILKSKDFSYNKIIQLFFCNQVVNFSEEKEKQIPITIYLWLQRFYIHNKAIRPIIILEERNGFWFNIFVRVPLKDGYKIDSLQEFLQNFSYQNQEQLSILKDLDIISEYLPEVEILIRSKGKEKPKFTEQRLLYFLHKILPVLNNYGIQVWIPKSLKNIFRPKVVLFMEDIPLKTYLDVKSIQKFEWKISIGDTIISKEEFEMLLKQKRKLITIKNHYVLIDEKEAKKILNFFNNPPTLNQNHLRYAVFKESYEDIRVVFSKNAKQQKKKWKKGWEVSIPENLETVLRPYQKIGYQWLYRNYFYGFGSILADDMGLGKTLQTIAFISKLKEERKLKENPVLIVVPTSLLVNWNHEIQKFAPQLKVFIYHSRDRNLNFKNIDVVLTTYTILRNEIKKFSQILWETVIIDEAQNIKNRRALQSRAVKKLKSNYKIALTGTPIENRLQDYWSIFDFVLPGYLGSWKSFKKNYEEPIELENNPYKIKQLKMITSPFLMRRLKTDKQIIRDLPDKIENEKYCGLTIEQIGLYNELKNEFMKTISSASRKERGAFILNLFLSLRQICNHPALYLRDNDWNPERSEKTLLLLEILEHIYDHNEKVLIFCVFKEMVKILKTIIERYFKKKVLDFHGELSYKTREETIRTFYQDKQYHTLILTKKTGGVGLNLTVANHVIHYDLWWNPAVENQATDRAYRIGQSKNVWVYHLITRGTLEEKIHFMLREKKQLADQMIQTTQWHPENWMHLTDQQIEEFIQLQKL